MNSFREKIMRFMYGRYGFDQLGRFLFGLAFVFWILCFFVRFLPWHFLYAMFSGINTALYIVAFFRILSKNTYKRTLENEKYLQIRAKVLPFLSKKTEKLKDKEHIYKNCPNCKAKLRLARVKGKHTTKCPRCGTKFNVRVWIEFKPKYNNPYDYR